MSNAILLKRDCGALKPAPAATDKSTLGEGGSNPFPVGTWCHDNPVPCDLWLKVPEWDAEHCWGLDPIPTNAQIAADCEAYRRSWNPAMQTNMVHLFLAGCEYETPYCFCNSWFHFLYLDCDIWKEPWEYCAAVACATLAWNATTGEWCLTFTNYQINEVDATWGCERTICRQAEGWQPGDPPPDPRVVFADMIAKPRGLPCCKPFPGEDCLAPLCLTARWHNTETGANGIFSMKGDAGECELPGAPWGWVKHCCRWEFSFGEGNYALTHWSSDPVAEDGDKTWHRYIVEACGKTSAIFFKTPETGSHPQPSITCGSVVYLFGWSAVPDMPADHGALPDTIGFVCKARTVMGPDYGGDFIITDCCTDSVPVEIDPDEFYCELTKVVDQERYVGTKSITIQVRCEDETWHEVTQTVTIVASYYSTNGNELKTSGCLPSARFYITMQLPGTWGPFWLGQTQEDVEWYVSPGVIGSPSLIVLPDCGGYGTPEDCIYKDTCAIGLAA